MCPLDTFPLTVVNLTARMGQYVRKDCKQCKSFFFIFIDDYILYTYILIWIIDSFALKISTASFVQVPYKNDGGIND
jgi:hypothetical protein